MTLLKADAEVAFLSEIKLEELWDKGKRGIILDLDNTITPWHQNKITAEAQAMIDKARSLSFKIHLLSNASFSRTRKVAAQLGIGCTAPGYKPFRRGFRLALKEMGLRAEQVVVIGDQIFTDIWGGNRSGCYTILVNPLERKEFFGTRIMRLMELIIGRQRTRL